MKRIMLFLVVLIMPLFLIYAVEETESRNFAELNLRGYKIGVEVEPYVVITDAITESLEIVSAESHDVSGSNTTIEEIDISKHIDTFLGNINSTSNEFFSDQMVFSYRVVGNTTGSFTLTMNMSDLIWVNESEIDISADADNTIGTRYDLSNLSYAFHGAYSDKYENSSIGFSESLNTKRAIPSSGSASLVSKWTVSNGEDETTPLPWIHRGAVAMTISSSDYSYDTGHPVGKYEAKVEVILSVD